MRHETDICEIAIAMTGASKWSPQRHLRNGYNTKGTTVVFVGEHRWASKYSITKEQHDAILEMLRQVAPMTCEEEPREDKVDPAFW